MKDEKTISRFLDDIDCLTPLLERTEKLNIFDVLGISRTEIRHSNMLAWLMDPNERHGLGDEVLRGMMDYSSVFSIQDYRSFSIRREWNFIDLMAVSETEKAILCVENKIDTGEHDDQLTRYKKLVDDTWPDYRRVFVYLTPTGKTSSDPEHWIAMGYEVILKIIDAALAGKQLSPEADLIIRNYTDTIRRHVIRDDSIRKTCGEIYRKHRTALEQIWSKSVGTDERKAVEEISLKYQAALDLIWKYRPSKESDHIADTIHLWAKLQTEDGKIEMAPDNTTNATTRFKTKYMSSLLPDVEGGRSAWKTENFYFYEIRNQAGVREHEVYIQLSVGSQGIPDDLRKTCDLINRYFPANQKKEDWDYRINFSTKHIFISEDADDEAIINQLDALLEDVFSFENELAIALRTEKPLL